MNDTRTARLLAAMAGNGFFLAKLAEHWLPEGRPVLVSVLISALVALLGVSAAYASLLWSPEKRLPVMLEAISAFCFIMNALFWLSRIRVAD